MVMQIMACDIGGTRTRVALYRVSNNIPTRGDVIDVANKHYDSLSHALHDCLNRLGSVSRLSAICLAAAGPVKDGKVKLTNSPWHVDSSEVAADINVEHIYLINDFIAQGHAVSALTPADVNVLQQGRARQEGVSAIIGAGTGLGQALIKQHGSEVAVFASEGGHVDFAPRDAVQIELLRYMLAKYKQVSVELLLSGRGLYNIYSFLRDTAFATESVNLASRFMQNDPAAVITSHADSDPLCRETLRLFCSIYGAHAANVGLSYLATGGVYLTGGVTRHIQKYLDNGELLEAFRHHKSMSKVLLDMPLQIITCEHPGLLGAALYAVRELST
jgi:glucokinase